MSDPIADPLAWAAKAEEDYKLVLSSLRRKVPLAYSATFRAQQCAEKYLKALLISTENFPPKTHDLVALYDLCEASGILIPVSSESFQKLSDYAVRIRYPGDDPTIDEAREAVEIAKSVRKFARKIL